MEVLRKELATRLHEATQALEVLTYAELHVWFVHLTESNNESATQTERKGSWTKLEVHRTREKSSSSLDESEKAERRAILECLAQIGGAVGPGGKTL